LWIADSTLGNAMLLKDIDPTPGEDSLIASPLVIGSTMYFRATDGTHGEELWKTDGTANGTQMVRDIVHGSGSSSPDQLTNVGGTLYITATDSDFQSGLWKSDGTPSGTKFVSNGAVGQIIS